jgi:hypothetical protein
MSVLRGCDYDEKFSRSSLKNLLVVKVKVTLRLTVSQSVCLGVVPHLGHMTRNLFVYFNFEKVTVLSMWAPSLTRGRVCRLSVSPLSLSVYIYTQRIYKTQQK